MFIHDLIKIKYINEGYLPNYPYHMISTSEICDAFLKYGFNNTGTGYFYYVYPKPQDGSDELKAAWDGLERTLVYYMCKLKYSEDIGCTLPDWVYSYMLGAVIGPMSNTLDIHDLITPLGVDNIDDEFSELQYEACYKVSRGWICKTKLNETYTITGNDMIKLHLPPTLFTAGSTFGSEVNLRPPTMFGEPHVIKSIRLTQQSFVK